MSIVFDFLKIIDQISERIKIPFIKDIYIPPTTFVDNVDSKSSNFGAIMLEDHSIGVFFISLSPEFKKIQKNTDIKKFNGMDPVFLAKKFGSSDIFIKTLAMGAINAISQHIFNISEYKFDFTSDSLGLINLNQDDKPGMVGFFPPLVKLIEKMGIKLTIIEKKTQLIKKTESWEVTLDPKQLVNCNKVLITSTTVLNESIDEILKFCSHAEKISIIGPTAGFFPDPLFARGVDIVGGTYIHNSKLFMELISENKRWGPSTKKYCIQKSIYPNILSILDSIKKK